MVDHLMLQLFLNNANNLYNLDEIPIVYTKIFFE